MIKVVTSPNHGQTSYTYYNLDPNTTIAQLKAKLPQQYCFFIDTI